MNLHSCEVFEFPLLKVARRNILISTAQNREICMMKLFTTWLNRFLMDLMEQYLLMDRLELGRLIQCKVSGVTLGRYYVMLYLASLQRILCQSCSTGYQKSYIRDISVVNIAEGNFDLKQLVETALEHL